MPDERDTDLRGSVGLCAACRHARRVQSDSKSTFYRCGLSDVDPRFVKYPPLPMRSCPGYEAGEVADKQQTAVVPGASQSAIAPRTSRSAPGTSQSVIAPGTSRPASASATPQPVVDAGRIVSLDVLRGFAILGILIINIQNFAMIDIAGFNPSAFGSLAGANGVVATLSHILADQKFMTLFAMLFGAGVLLMASRREAKGLSSKGLHYRRMSFLLGFGLLHAYFIWSGDILVAYALCGSLVYPFRNRTPAFLITAGLLTVSVVSVFTMLSGWSLHLWSPEQLGDLALKWQPDPDGIVREVNALRGGWSDQMAQRAPTALEFQTLVFLGWGLWRAGGLMLVGMGFFKLGILDAGRSRRFYGTLVALGLLVGVPVVAYGWHRNVQAGWDFRYSVFFGMQYNYWASLVVSMGWLGLIMLACKSPALGWITTPLSAAGRMALSNYIGQSVICTLIFYGHGLGYFGRIDRVGQIGIIAVVWLLQLLVSPIWLRYFRYGPLEWVWRSLTYRRCQPMWRE